MSNYETDVLVDMFKALSNPHRLTLFQRLMTCCAPGTRCLEESVRFFVRELGEGMEIAPSTLSHHLKELNRAGLVNMERRGKNIECWVDPKTIQLLAEFFSLEK